VAPRPRGHRRVDPPPRRHLISGHLCTVEVLA
jgi:hypothetical protein